MLLAGAEASVGSKQCRQRASYIPVAPTSTRSLLATSRCVWLAGFPQMTQIAAKLNDNEIKAVADYIAGVR